MNFQKLPKQTNAFPGNHLRTRKMTKIRTLTEKRYARIEKKSIPIVNKQNASVDSIMQQLSHLRNLADVLKTIPSVARRVKRSHKSRSGSGEDGPASARLCRTYPQWCHVSDLQVHPRGGCCFFICKCRRITLVLRRRLLRCLRAEIVSRVLWKGPALRWSRCTIHFCVCTPLFVVECFVIGAVQYMHAVDTTSFQK